MNLLNIDLNKNKLLEVLSHSETISINNTLELNHKEIIEKVIQANIREGEKEGVLVGEKWRIALEQKSNEKYFICNTYEREIENDISNILLKNNPKEIVQGILLGAYCIGSKKACIYICKDNVEAIERIRKEILNFNSEINIEIKEVDRDAIYGDEIAAINILESKLNNKNISERYPLSKFLNNEVVTINRPETLIKVASLFNEEEFRDLSKSKFVILDGVLKSNEIFNVNNETTFSDLIYNIGGGISEDKEVKALLINGNTGVLIPPELFDISINDSKILIDEISKVMKIKVIYSDECIIHLLKNITSLNNSSSCNKCVLCREGSLQFKTILDDITEGKSKGEDISTLKQLSKVINTGAGCSFGRNISNIISSALEYFYIDFEEHINKKKCSALVCKKYFSYHILGKMCKGCEECLEKCPVEAINGGSNLIHVIDQDECIKCGLCEEVCEYDAVVKAGLIKPKTPLKPVRVGTWKR